MLATSIAVCVYACAIAGFILCPLHFVFNIIFNKMSMITIPQCEQENALSQWAPCVLNRYHATWEGAGYGCFARLKRRVLSQRKQPQRDSASPKSTGVNKSLPLLPRDSMSASVEHTAYYKPFVFHATSKWYYPPLSTVVPQHPR